MSLQLSSVSSSLQSSCRSPEQIAVHSSVKPSQAKEGGSRRERLRVQHMEHVVGVKHSFQLSQFYKHAGWKNE